VRRLANEGVRADAALAVCLSWKSAIPTHLDLVWLEEPYDQSVHYDALIHLSGAGTVSLSFAPDGGYPGPWG
jgi:hypothetical protein